SPSPTTTCTRWRPSSAPPSTTWPAPPSRRAEVDFRAVSLADLAGDVRTGRVSSRELVQHALDRIAALNPRVNAFVAVDEHAAQKAAAEIDAQVASGQDPGPLAGIPLAVKDLEDAAGFVTSSGSLTHRDDPPAARDSVLVARLKAAGCVVLGKT